MPRNDNKFPVRNARFCNMVTALLKCQIEKELHRPVWRCNAIGVAIGLFLTIALLTGCRHFRAAASPPPARLVGVLWWMSPADLNLPIQAWQTDLDQLQALGIRTLVLNGPHVGENAATSAPDPMEAFFAEADHRGLSIYLDTLAAPNWWTLTDPAPEIARAQARIESLARRHGKHPSFTGFYIPYELYVMWDAQAGLITALYRDVSAACKRVSPDKAVMISPFFILDQAGHLGDFRWASPAEYQQFWTALLKQTRVDIVALQDSGEHLSCYTLDQRRPFLAAMKAACEVARKTYWINVEMAELAVESLPAYTNRFGYKTHVNDPKTAPAWQAVAPDKFGQKLELAGDYTDTTISWGYQHFVRPALGTGAERIHESYRAMLRTRSSDVRPRWNSLAE
jgi:hypothetical protein